MSRPVPRETLLNGPTVRPILFRKYLREANDAGVKDTTRRVIAADNCEVQPGTFDGLILDSGRARLNQPRAELRAQCKFESGRVRVVSVFPVVKIGDLFYVKDGRYGSRKASTQTLEVRRIRVSRLQDMSNADCYREGVGPLLPTKFWAMNAEPRLAFARLWEDLNGPATWSANPWVWVYEYTVHKLNVDAYLQEAACSTLARP